MKRAVRAALALALGLAGMPCAAAAAAPPARVVASYPPETSVDEPPATDLVAGRPAEGARGVTAYVLAAAAPRAGHAVAAELREAEVATGRILRTLYVPHVIPMGGLVRAGGALWIGQSGGALLRVDERTWAAVSVPGIAGVDGLAADGDRLVVQTSAEPRAWIAPDDAPPLAKVRVTHVLDARTSAVVASRVGRPFPEPGFGLFARLVVGEGVLVQVEAPPRGGSAWDFALVASDAATLTPLARREIRIAHDGVVAEPRLALFGGRLHVRSSEVAWQLFPRTLGLAESERHEDDAPVLALGVAGALRLASASAPGASCVLAPAPAGAALRACWGRRGLELEAIAAARVRAPAARGADQRGARSTKTSFSAWSK